VVVVVDDPGAVDDPGVVGVTGSDTGVVLLTAAVGGGMAAGPIGCVAR
jgi:hypothetical protein